MLSNILVTGGAGYIGSHTCLLLLEAGFNVIVIDNLSNASQESLHRVEQLTGKKISFYKADIGDTEAINLVFNNHQIDGVIHFAGLKAVGESTQIPLEYYQQNITGTLNLLKVMSSNHCFNIVFSSSASVYGEPETVPVTEGFPTGATNPYARSKLFIEEIMKDVAKSDQRWRMVLLRYFNPIGAHSSGRIGEDPHGTPNNLVPYLCQVVSGKLDRLMVFGDDYPTVDGTGVRDYIHVTDLSNAHVKSIEKIMGLSGVSVFNIGTGKGYSVFQVISAFEAVVGRSIPVEVVARRAGDIAQCWADASEAEIQLGWKADKGLAEMVEDCWRWQSNNPHGYDS